MKALVKPGNLPPAPAPTRARRVIDPWEAKLYRDAQNSPTMGEFKKKSPYTVWTDKQLETMREMWLDGRIAKDIAPHVGGNVRATQNRLSYMISRGEIPRRKSGLTDDEKEDIRADYKNGMTVPAICRKHIVSQGSVRQICKELMK